MGPAGARGRARGGAGVAGMRGSFAMGHSGRMRPQLVAVFGLHGALSDAELGIHVIVVPPGAGA